VTHQTSGWRCHLDGSVARVMDAAVGIAHMIEETGAGTFHCQHFIGFHTAYIQGVQIALTFLHDHAATPETGIFANVDNGGACELHRAEAFAKQMVDKAFSGANGSAIGGSVKVGAVVETSCVLARVDNVGTECQRACNSEPPCDRLVYISWHDHPSADPSAWIDCHG